MRHGVSSVFRLGHLQNTPIYHQQFSKKLVIEGGLRFIYSLLKDLIASPLSQQKKKKLKKKKILFSFSLK